MNLISYRKFFYDFIESVIVLYTLNRESKIPPVAMTHRSHDCAILIARLLTVVLSFSLMN